VTTWQGRRLLVVVAHPDDETFGCGSVIADAVVGGAEVTVCCATRGEAGEVMPGCDLAGASLGELREQELRAAAAVLGVREIVVLDFVDSGMHGEPAPETLLGAPLGSVVSAVADVVVRTDPDVVLTLDVAGGDGHRDHVRIAEATTEAVRREGRGASLYYWCLVRSLLRRWLERVQQLHPEGGHLELDQDGLGRPDEDITTMVDTSAHVQRRWAAMAMHRSQRSPFDDMPADLVEAFVTCDRLVRAEPLWTGGPVERQLFVRRR
jgi:LmbE family N-acetylglucosaminyl deacetylase